jgi:hypothetical protein
VDPVRRSPPAIDVAERSLLVVGSMVSKAAAAGSTMSKVAAPPGGSDSWARNELIDGLGNGLTDRLLFFYSINRCGCSKAPAFVNWLTEVDKTTASVKV